MTAEIALLNRRALTFAADSAITISGGGSDKIYNSAEKIFQLSYLMPLGLMLYNNMEFVGAPLDVLARKFRTEKDRNFETCQEAADCFIEFLTTFKRSLDDEYPHLDNIIVQEFCEINKEFEKGFPEVLYEHMNRGNRLPDLNEVGKQYITQIINEHTRIHLDRPLKDYLDDKSFEEFSSTYGARVESCIKKTVKEVQVDADVAKLLTELAFASVKSEIFSEGLTGLVFGGFAGDDIFPSLWAIEIDGIFFGKIKQKKFHSVEIARSGERAAIIPFAQSEMVERFLFGVDAELEKTLLKFVQKSGDKAVAKVADSGVDVSNLGLDPIAYTGDIERLLARLKERSRNEIQDMVDFMPKQELAYAAEAFISLTSLKRKVSAQQETVGGPIDVAVITRNEGFVWIKRKHYFNSDLNPSYSQRVSQALATGASNERT